MAWTAALIAELCARTRAPIFSLERVQLYNEPSLPIALSSHLNRGTSAGADRTAQITRVETQGATLSPRGWTTTIGAFTVTVAGSLKYLMSRLVRGSVVALKIGFAGWEASEFEIIALGQVRQIGGRAPFYQIECYDAYSALRERVTNAVTTRTLFGTTGTLTSSAAAYAVGDATLQVSSTSNFKRQTSGTGCLMVSPASGADPFYLTYTGTGTGPTRFTGVSATGQFGTTASAAASSSAVNEVAYLYGHPLDLARKVLTSRGSGTNGTYDVLPEVWGLGVDKAFIDSDDIEDWKLVVKASSGTYSWDVLVNEEQEDAFGWVEELLSAAGLFLGVRQGLLTVRAGQDSHGASTGHLYRYDGIDITDADIIDVEDYGAWDSDHADEYSRVLVQGSGVSTSSGPSTTFATLPGQATLTYDLRDRLFSNVAPCITETKNRVDESARRVPERIVLQSPGLRLAQLAVGDLTYLTTSRIESRWYDTFTATPAIVAEVSPQWTSGTTRTTLLVYPDDDEVYP